MAKILSTLLAFLILGAGSISEAAFTPASVSIVPPIQFPPSDFSITGVRVSALWGRHRDVYGVDLGLIGNITDQDFVGLGVSGLFNVTHGMTTILGLQAAGLANYNTQKTDVYGVQIAAGLNMNTATSKVVGIQAALLGNLAANTDVYGFQVGLYNKAKEVYGLQIGLINEAANLHGVQIGLVNFNRGGMFAVAPVLNVGF